MFITCRKCGKDLSGKEYKMVADWPFCMECFQRLMEGPAKKTEKDISQPALRKDKSICPICKTEIEEGKGKKLLGMTLCHACYADLIARPQVKPGIEVKPKDEEPKTPQVRIDVHKTIQCAGCGRSIPSIGSKEFEGKRYCPDCYYDLPEVKTAGPTPFQRKKSDDLTNAEEVVSGSSDDETVQKCDSCGREVSPDNLKKAEGFLICRACMSTDPALAVEIARARRRKQMEQLKIELAPA